MTPISSSPDSSTSPKVVRHHLDQPVGPGPFSFSVGDEVIIAGWAFLEPPSSTMPSIAMEIVNLQSGAVTPLDARRCPRPDVANHSGVDRLQMSGFTSRLLIDARLRGAHRVRLFQSEDSHSYPAVDLFSFTVLPASHEVRARKELAARFVRGAGLEIGALQRRLEVPADCSVTYVDRMPLAGLRAHYPELRDQPVQEPDLIDDGETLAKVGNGTQDFVIANHFLEHCENPIQTIVNLTRVLKEGGILYMAVPDKRFTFDIDRPVTPYQRLAETFRQGFRRDREELYVEWAACVQHASPSDVPTVARKLLDEKYSIHFNVWALPDLLEFLARSRADFGLPFTLEWVVCSDNEVILILMKAECSP
jgi:SAM-dependent methyltransferase